MNFLVVHLTIALVLLVLTHSERQEINLVLKHIAPFANKKYVANITMPRKPLNRSTSIISTDVYFQPNVTLDSPLYIEFTANKKFRTEYRPFMIRFKVDFCDFVKFKNHPYFKFIANINDGQNNMLDPCPFKGHRFIKPRYTSYDHFLPMIPVGMWRCDIRITKPIDNKEELVFGYSDYYEITPKGIIEF